MILREKQGTKVRVTFRLPSTIWAESVHLVGDFNDWSRTSHPLRRTRDGEWEISLQLEEGKTYQFRYLVNG
ncbi:MAG: isoamylase early set domain-containing protein, partial [Anaerolineae bacterium]